MPPVGIVLSHSEPPWVKDLTFGGVPTSVEQIDTDILMLCDDGAVVGVERKDPEDFLNALRADRLFPELEKLRSLTPWTYLVITGDLRPGPNGKCFTADRESGWNWASVAGALLSVQEIGVHVVQCPENDFQATVLRLANRDRTTMRVRPARDTTVITEAEAFLTGLPGIGSERAQALLSYCGSAAWALTMLSTRGIRPATGIGDGIKARVRRALGLEEWQTLAVIDQNGNAIPPDVLRMVGEITKFDGVINAKP